MSKRRRVEKKSSSSTGLKGAQAWTPEIWQKRLSEQKGVYIGMDLSVRSPATAAIDFDQKTIYLLGARQKKSNQGSHVNIPCDKIFAGWKLSLELLDGLPDSSVARTQRYDWLVNMALTLPRRWAPSSSSSASTIQRIGIEGYSFQSQNTEADTMLKELGGCVRWQVWQQYQTQPLEIPPKSIKKLFLASGAAGKKEMIENAEKYFGLPNLFQLIGCNAQIKNLHPVEDLVDAFAAAIAAVQLSCLT